MASTSNHSPQLQSVPCGLSQWTITILGKHKEDHKGKMQQLKHVEGHFRKQYIYIWNNHVHNPLDQTEKKKKKKRHDTPLSSRNSSRSHRNSAKRSRLLRNLDCKADVPWKNWPFRCRSRNSNTVFFFFLGGSFIKPGLKFANDNCLGCNWLIAGRILCRMIRCTFWYRDMYFWDLSRTRRCKIKHRKFSSS